MRRRAGVILVAASGACSLTTSFDGLTGGSTDAGADVRAGDAQPPADAGPGAEVGGDSSSPTPDAPSGFSCAALSPSPLFCDDFDEDTPLPPTKLSSGGDITIDTMSFVSSPRSAHFTMPALSDSTPVGHAYFDQNFKLNGPPTTITLGFDVRVDGAEPSESPIITFELPSGYEVAYFVGGDGAHLREGVPNGGNVTYTSTNVSPLTLAKWVHLDMAFDVGPGKSNVTLSYDRAKVYTLPLVFDQFNANEIEVQIGFDYAQPGSQARDVHADNVVIDMK